MKNHTNPTQLRHRHRCCVGFIVTSFQHYTIRKLKGKEKNYTNYTQIATQTLHLSDFPRVTKCKVCASNYAQTIHKPDIQPYIERQRVKERKRQRVKKTKSQKDKESKRQRVKKTKSQKVKERKRQRDKESKRQRVKKCRFNFQAILFACIEQPLNSH